MRGAIPTLAMTISLLTVAADAFDAQGADIIGLRLGMPEAEVVMALGHQGFSATRDRDALIAKTRDGNLTIDLMGSRVHEIRYEFQARGAGEADKIATSILDRFGSPNQTNPMSWCQSNGRDGTCPPQAASLTFFPETRTLVLRAGTPMPP
ncbi:MAG TPA: hypothetical protein DDZ81_10725 [Acetobacteraceae bacterium]|nr:hypothetical protein [Acetobacteraceae bacterium]